MTTPPEVAREPWWMTPVMLLAWGPVCLVAAWRVVRGRL